MYKNSFAQNLEGIIGYLSWAMVCYLTLNDQPTDTFSGQILLFAIVAGLLLFIVGFYFATRPQVSPKNDIVIRLSAIFIQFIAIILIRVLSDSGVVVILSVALAALLPMYLNQLSALLGVLALILVDFWFNQWHWHLQDALIWTMLAAAFHLFAFRMTQRVIQEQEARDEIATLNRELIATQALLEESSKHSERMRISRDLHDGLGHHLTALILKLQYLTYTTEGDTKNDITEAYDLARELLQDVRSTVHQMREQSTVSFNDALDALIAQVPDIDIKLNLDEDIKITDVAVTEALFRSIQEAITNTLKHSKATEISISLSKVDQNLRLIIKDNGKAKHTIIEGNGLLGMQERVQNVQGQVQLDSTDGFSITINIPYKEEL
ncbi:sensor histidine kinase [Reinekea marina]|uniref:Sensor histidine kinase n=1 Tax=Reinekea marina TaxID=1310421 RepID=A0ABV7WMJ4_9GAMM